MKIPKIAVVLLILSSLFALPVYAQMPPGGLNIEPVVLQEDQQLAGHLPEIIKGQGNIEALRIDDSGKLLVYLTSSSIPYSFQLRDDETLLAHQSMLNLLLFAFNTGKIVRILSGANNEIRSVIIYKWESGNV